MCGGAMTYIQMDIHIQPTQHHWTLGWRLVVFFLCKRNPSKHPMECPEMMWEKSKLNLFLMCLKHFEVLVTACNSLHGVGGRHRIDSNSHSRTTSYVVILLSSTFGMVKNAVFQKHEASRSGSGNQMWGHSILLLKCRKYRTPGEDHNQTTSAVWASEILGFVASKDLWDGNLVPWTWTRTSAMSFLSEAVEKCDIFVAANGNFEDSLESFGRPAMSKLQSHLCPSCPGAGAQLKQMMSYILGWDNDTHFTI